MVARIVNRLEEGIIALLLVGSTLLVFVAVVLRFGFGTGFLWTDEMTLLLSAWLVLFGASYGVKVGAHIGVDAIINMIPAGPRRLVSLFAVTLSLVYCGLILYGSWVYLAKVHSIGLELEDLPVPKWIGHSILFLGFCLLAFRFVQAGWNLATGRATSLLYVDEAAEALEEVSKAGDAAGVGNGNEP